MSTTVAFSDALELTVGDVMIRRPKTLPADALIGDVRQMFEQPSVRTVLLADGDRFCGVVERDDLPADAPDRAPASDYVEADTLTVTPETPMREAAPLLRRRGEPRLVVLDEDGVTLRGLLCANTDGTGFCVKP